MYHILDVNNFKSHYQEDFSKISPFDAGIPLTEVSDPTMQQIYYYRWHTYCSHIRETPASYVVTEFTHDVPWTGIYNTIVCAAGHHLYEGRWLANKRYVNDHSRFWFTPEANLRLYSFWAANAVYAVCSAWGDFTLAKELFDDLKNNYHARKKEFQADNGLYYQFDVNDGMELMISGHGFRPTIQFLPIRRRQGTGENRRHAGQSRGRTVLPARSDGRQGED